MGLWLGQSHEPMHQKARQENGSVHAGMPDLDSGPAAQRPDQVNRLPASPNAGSSKKSSWSHVIGEMSGGQDRDDESDTNRACRLDTDKNSRIAAQHPSEKTAGLPQT